MVNFEIPKHRVVVTGLGAVSSIGIGVENFWPSLLAGRSGVSPVSSFDTVHHASTIGGEIRDFHPEKHVRPEILPHCGRASQLAIAAARLALHQSGLSSASLPAAESGIFVGTTMGECQLQESLVRGWNQHQETRLDPGMVLQVPHGNLACNVAWDLDLEGCACLTIPTACAAANYALLNAFDAIRDGSIRIALAGGADAFSQTAHTGFGRMMALTPDRCRPFDKNRQGIIIGEGAAILVLESLAHARQRGSPILAELLGGAFGCDAHHMTIPNRPTIAAVMRKALAACNLAPEQIDAVSAHGTGTRQNDQTEAQAIREVFGPNPARPPVFSIKSMLGHTMGAASGLEAIACVMALRDGWLPPTIHFETPDEECPVDCVPNQARRTDPKIIMNNAFAFGGNNAITVFARVN
ncbi:MAG: beta-ketoacyl-[acyl-carrier-protein] synthase family protein [Verrucomicrobiae bacterium]|nr:beta-ketoacyl-[acyl-carrier-protein] synthase family protein [Verrucomicrobiae bacterium]